MNQETDSIEERARAYGVDISQVEANFALSPEQRLTQHQEALNLLLALEEIRTIHGESKPSS